MSIGYFAINRYSSHRIASLWLWVGSLFFYGYWNYQYLSLIIGSIIVNYYVSKKLVRDRGGIFRSYWLAGGLSFNILLLGYFKYITFFITNFNYFLGFEIELIYATLPLGISFFTFQQIAFLVDSYQRKTNNFDPLKYGIFVCFFPQLIAGPIVHHAEMMPQFEDPQKSKVNYRNVATGVYIFIIGLFKKAVVADYLAIWVNEGYSAADQLTLIDSWITSISYSFQLYFDFSGYTDMAMGAALIFNIRLPMNFDSPYKALNIQEFWRRWHITLSRFLQAYVYIPLGGNWGDEFVPQAERRS